MGRGVVTDAEDLVMILPFQSAAGGVKLFSGDRVREFLIPRSLNVISNGFAQCLMRGL